MVVRLASIFASKELQKIIEGVVVLFALYILFQIVRKMFGGSWDTENIIIGLLVFNLGCVFTIGILVAQLKSDHNNLKWQFKNLANDFKMHIKKK